MGEFGGADFENDSALMRRAVPVSEDDAGFADDPADGGAGVAFLRADPFDEDGAALGGEGDAGLAEAFEELDGFPVESRGERPGIEGGGLEVQAGEIAPEALGNVHWLAVPGEIEAGEQPAAGVEWIGLVLALVLIAAEFAVFFFGLGHFVFRGENELHLKGDVAVIGHRPVFQAIAVDGFVPVRFRSVVRSACGDGRGGEGGE